jgi:hypothetical protein
MKLSISYQFCRRTGISQRILSGLSQVPDLTNSADVPYQAQRNHVLKLHPEQIPTWEENVREGPAGWN